MGLFRRKQAPIIEIRDDETDMSSGAELLEAKLGRELITREGAMSIPAVAACVNRIADTVASLDIKLYEKKDDDTIEIEGDVRVERLNGNTGDTLTGYQLKRAMVVDMLLGKGGYAFIRKSQGEVKGLHYVPSYKISIDHGTDPIIKTCRFQIDGKRYEPFQFVKLLRNTENGWSGRSIIEDSKLLFEIVTASQAFEKAYSQRGGVKKGYLQSQGRISDEAKKALKESYARMYSNDTENIVVLNEGLTFKEASATSQELQLNENKTINNEDICKIFGIPPKIISGGATPEDRRLYYEGCIYPILIRFSKALDDSLLNPFLGEEDFYFAFDDSLLTRADIESRYKAYEIGLKSGFLQLDEIRQKENLPAYGLDFVKLGLQDVLLYPDTGDVYTPNAGLFANLKNKEVYKPLEETKGEDADEHTNQE